MGGRRECRARECLARRRARHDARDGVENDVYDERGVDREVDP